MAPVVPDGINDSGGIWTDFACGNRFTISTALLNLLLSLASYDVESGCIIGPANKHERDAVVISDIDDVHLTECWFVVGCSFFFLNSRDFDFVRVDADSSIVNVELSECVSAIQGSKFKFHLGLTGDAACIEFGEFSDSLVSDL